MSLIRSLKHGPLNKEPEPDIKIKDIRKVLNSLIDAKGIITSDQEITVVNSTVKEAFKDEETFTLHDANLFKEYLASIADVRAGNY